MVSFLHIADKNDEAGIVRNGIRAGRLNGLRGVFAVPVVPDYAITHQWARVLAAEAATAFLCHVEPFGLAAIIPRKIRASEIQRTYLAPRITGWRYYPEAKGRPPFCHCRFCNRGEIRAQRLIRDEE